MDDNGFMTKQSISRRDVVRRSLAVGVGVTASGAVSTTLARQGTPVAGSDYARPEQAIEAEALMERIDDPMLTVVALTPSEAFADGHIPGAVQIDWPPLEVIDTSEASIASWREEMERVFAELGVGADHTVVTYDGGTLFAARLWWVLHYLGHADTRVLNGGRAAWELADGELMMEASTGTPVATPAAASSRRETRSDALAPLAEVEASLDDPDVAIIDARTPEEYADGHIPGAVNINYPQNALSEEPMLWRSQDDLLAMYEAVGVTADKRVIPYCSTGVRSAVTAYALWLIGYPNVGLYTGSWMEWSDHPELPIVTGDQP